MLVHAFDARSHFCHEIPGCVQPRGQRFAVLTSLSVAPPRAQSAQLVLSIRMVFPHYQPAQPVADAWQADGPALIRDSIVQHQMASADLNADSIAIENQNARFADGA
jgi:hypothetical protein